MDSSTRPDWITHNGWRESVFYHDRGYVMRKHQFKRQLVASHPDRKRHTFTVTSEEAVRKAPWNYDRCKCDNWKAIQSSQCNACARTVQNPASFHTVQAKYKAWLIEESKWYNERGLTPPGGRLCSAISRSSGVAYLPAMTSTAHTTNNEDATCGAGSVDSSRMVGGINQ